MCSWHSFPACGKEHVAVVFMTTGCQHLKNGCLQLIGTEITQDEKRKLLDTPLTLILRMWWWQHCGLFCRLKLPICQLCITATRSRFNYHTYKTTNRWHSVNAQSQNVAVTVLLSLLPNRAANTSVILNSDQITVQLPNLPDYKWLTLCWR